MAKPYKWTVEFTVDPSWVADGFDLTAAQALCDKMHWGGELIGGGTKNGYAWVFVGQIRKVSAV